MDAEHQVKVASPLQELIRAWKLGKDGQYHFASPADQHASRGTVFGGFDSYDEVHVESTKKWFSFAEEYSQCTQRIGHRQLRNLVSATSEYLFFPSSKCVATRYNPSVNKEMEIINMPDRSFITTLHATDDLLVLGSSEGRYALRSLIGDESTRSGTVVSACVTNQVYSCRSRAGPVQAVFSSNDGSLRVLDVRTERWEVPQEFDEPVNCAASSPDGNARVLVFDNKDPCIVDADGKPISKLSGHTRSGFACAWAPEGHNIATAYEDGFVNIYDDRTYRRFAHIRAQQRCIRSLQFSSSTYGPPLLIAAEENDIVHIYNAQTFETEQRIENVGELSGISFAPDGQSLFVGNAERGISKYQPLPALLNG